MRTAMPTAEKWEVNIEGSRKASVSRHLYLSRINNFEIVWSLVQPKQRHKWYGYYFRIIKYTVQSNHALYLCLESWRGVNVAIRSLLGICLDKVKLKFKNMQQVGSWKHAAETLHNISTESQSVTNCGLWESSLSESGMQGIKNDNNET
jgi:hypothetical protein